MMRGVTSVMTNSLPSATALRESDYGDCLNGVGGGRRRGEGGGRGMKVNRL